MTQENGKSRRRAIVREDSVETMGFKVIYGNYKSFQLLSLTACDMNK